MPEAERDPPVGKALNTPMAELSGTADGGAHFLFEGAGDQG